MPPKTTVNGEYYIIVLKILRQYISRKCHELVGDWTLHQDNIALISLFLFSSILINAISKFIPHPPYRPDVAL